MNIIAKIRAEIRRLYAEDSDRHIVCTSLEALSNLMDFLDTLEEPVSEDLEQEMDDYIGKHFHTRFDETLEVGCDPLKTADFVAIARHFAEWGAEHLADASKMISEDLEEAANQYIGYPPEIDEGVITAARRIAFKAGAEWQKDKDTEAVIIAEDRGFIKGADWARAEMMEDGK